MNILIPMAGNGQRFVDAGYDVPKPLIDVLGKPMIERVVENLGGPDLGHYIFVVRREHEVKHSITAYLRSIVPQCSIVIHDGVTAGAACTALLATELIDNMTPLLIANADQIVKLRRSHTGFKRTDAYNSCLWTFRSRSPKWSYAAVSEEGTVWGIAEKQPISDHATCGIYYWRRGTSFVRCAREMIDRNIRVNNEFYIAPAFNEAIINGDVVQAFDVDEMWGLGTPEDLRVYEDCNRPR